MSAGSILAVTFGQFILHHQGALEKESMKPAVDGVLGNEPAVSRLKRHVLQRGEQVFYFG